jgi:hypothetical protein
MRVNTVAWRSSWRVRSLRRRDVQVPPLTSREESLDSHIMAFASRAAPGR